MDKKIALITGSSSGFGLLIALELAKNGFYVVATMRDQAKKRKLLDEAIALGIEKNIQIHELDVTLKTSIEKVPQLLKKLGRIDILINNAGYAAAGFAEDIHMDEYRRQFETNFFGAVAVTQACLPMMREQGKGTIINISSISGRMGFPGLSPYVASKHAIEGWSECLRLEMKPYGINVVLVEPGSYQTEIWTSGKQVSKKSLNPKSPYFEYMNRIERQLEKSEATFGDPKEVAELIVRILTQKKIHFRYPIGNGVKFVLFLRKCISWNLWETLFLKKLKN
ncbi:oxidoreductase [Bacillus sp. 03113]|uniref:oxidoreductase n=1 Tax=Bacillus sp. 03113 TaxID=2578211 RepID=UPI0011443CCD|nr:oxidoreductase [Bacillus sp. 03113]